MDMFLPMMLALAAPQNADAANVADLQCMAVFAVATSNAPADKQLNIAMGTMFFYGKISGRAPGLNVEARLFELLRADPKGEGLEKERQRCAKEVQDHGTLLMAMGERMIAAGKAE